MRLLDYVYGPELEEMLREGFVSEQRHPELPLAILNYTKRAQYERAWNLTTLKCRGLIYDVETGEVVARPWPKFFNYGEPVDGGEPEPLDLDAEVTVRDKLDGSLGILYPDADGYAIATRGSFTSEQALKGTEILRRTRFVPYAGVTYLFEIIYPGNRIVLDYGGEEKLVLLGIVDNETGQTDHGEIGWPGEFAPFLHAPTLRDALALEPRPNAEGVVVRFKSDGRMLKIKQEDYVALHRIVTGLNERTVWEHVGAGGDIDELKAPLPEEFHDWVDDVYVDLRFRADHVYYAAREAFEGIKAGLGEGFTRKDFALEAQEPEYADVRPYLFNLLDGKDPSPSIWRSIRPVRPRTLVNEAAES